MLPVPPNAAGTGGAPVESTAMRKVVSVLTALAGKTTWAPLASVTVPPAAPITGGGAGGGGGGGGGGGTAGAGAGETGVGELPPSPPPQPTNANKQTVATSPVRVPELPIFLSSRPAKAPVRGSMRKKPEKRLKPPLESRS